MDRKTLAEFVETVNGTGHLRVEKDYGDGFVRLQTSEAERRQAAQDIRCSENIVLELLRNSRDAHAANLFVATAREGSTRQIVVIDDGAGIPEAMHKLVFEPRVTSKLDTSHMDSWGLHGRGMALYSIAANAQEALVAQSQRDRGCAIVVKTETTALPEKSDQSTFPSFELGADGVVKVRGPKNLVRTVCEFAIECRGQCSVYLGSPAEIAAALVAHGTAQLSAVERLFCEDVASLPLTLRLSTAASPAELADMCSQMGLQISERTARRILDGAIDAAPKVLDQVRITQSPSKRPKRRVSRNNVVSLDKHDRDRLAHAFSKAFAEIAYRYYLEDDVPAQVYVRDGRLTASLPLIPHSGDEELKA